MCLIMIAVTEMHIFFFSQELSAPTGIQLLKQHIHSSTHVAIRTRQACMYV